METQQRISKLKELVAERTSKKDGLNSTQQQIAKRRIRLLNETKLQRQRRFQQVKERKNDAHEIKDSILSNRLSFADYRIQHDTDKYARKMVPIPSGKAVQKEHSNGDHYPEQEKYRMSSIYPNKDQIPISQPPMIGQLFEQEGQKVGEIQQNKKLNSSFQPVRLDKPFEYEKQDKNQFLQPEIIERTQKHEKQATVYNIFTEDNPLNELKTTNIFSFNNSSINSNPVDINIFGGNQKQVNTPVSGGFNLNFSNNSANIDIFTEDNPFYQKKNLKQNVNQIFDLMPNPIILNDNTKQAQHQQPVNLQSVNEAKQIKLFGGTNIFSLKEQSIVVLQTENKQQIPKNSIFQQPDNNNSQSIPASILFSGNNMQSNKQGQKSIQSAPNLFSGAATNLFTTSNLFSTGNLNKQGHKAQNQQQKPAKEPAQSIFSGGNNNFSGGNNIFSGGNNIFSGSNLFGVNQTKNQSIFGKNEQKQNREQEKLNQDKQKQKESSQKNVFQIAGSSGGLFKQSPSGLFGNTLFSNKKQDFKNKQQTSNIFGGSGSMFSTTNMFSTGGAYTQQSNFGNIFSGPSTVQRKQEEEQDDEQEDGDQALVAEEDGADPTKSTGNYKQYTETETLFKQTVAKFKRQKQGSDLIENVTISIEKLPNNDLKRLIIRFANKSIPNYGDVVIHPTATQVSRSKGNAKSFAVKKLIRKSQEGKLLQQNFKIMFKEDSHGDQFLKAFQSKK